MTNIVDTSPETVNAEFDAAEQAIGPDEAQEQQTQQEQAQAQVAEEQKQAEILMAKGMIATSLRFAVGSFVGVSIDNELYEQTAESYAVLIIKYFPGGMFAFLDQFKEEFAAITATVMLIKVTSEAKAKQREEEEAKAKTQASGKATTFAPEQTEKGEANGDA